MKFFDAEKFTFTQWTYILEYLIYIKRSNGFCPNECDELIDKEEFYKRAYCPIERSSPNPVGDPPYL